MFPLSFSIPLQNGPLFAIISIGSDLRLYDGSDLKTIDEISTVILLPSADSFKRGCCQLQAKVCARITGYPLVQACPGKSVVR